MSASFTTKEKKIAQLLSKFPFLKNKIKYLYQYINYLIYKKDYKIKSNFGITKYAPPKKESFFGYYDKSPLSNDGRYLLFHTTNLPSYSLPKPEPISVVLYDLSGGRVSKATETVAWNWQQGSRLQWLDNEHFIFNDFDSSKKKYVARLFSRKPFKEVERYDKPIQDAHGGNSYFLSINYRRLLSLRSDYGYRCLPPLNKNEIREIENDGIWKIDCDKNHTELLYSLKDIISYQYRDEFKQAKHYVNHIMISPQGDKFIFLHRYFIQSKRFDRLLLSDSRGNHLKVLADNEMVSHCCWIDNNSILGYLRGPDGNNGFYIIDINSGSYTPYANGEFDKNGDGHPHISDGWFVSDSYPDKSRMQQLTICNLDTDQKIKIGEFFHGFRYKDENRCDLHPRFSANGDEIFIDTVYSGRRKLVSVDISTLSDVMK